MEFYPMVKTITPLGDYVLYAEFVTGEKRKYDMKPLIEEREPFYPLADVCKLFEQVRIDCRGAGIVWNDEIDLAAEELYYNGTEV